MANYINRSILCQAYVHIEETDLTDEEMDSFRLFIEKFILERGQFFFTPAAESDVRIKEGSEIIYATILGGSGAIYSAIAAYPSFRQGVTSLSRDASRLTAGIISECLFQVRSTQFESIRIESRVGVFGKVDRAITLIDTVHAGLESVKPKTTCNRISRIDKELQSFFYRIDDQIDRDYIKNELFKIADTKLPARIPKSKKVNPTTEENRIYRATRASLIDTLSV